METASTQQTIHLAMQNAYQAGILSRASRALIGCQQFGEFVQVVSRTFEELDCCGCAKFTFAEDSSHIRLGKGVGKQCNCENSIVLNSKRVALIIDISKKSATESGLLRDSISIFFDTMNSWLEHHSSIHDERKETALEKMDIVKNLDNFTECLYRINDHLLETQQHVREDLLSQLIGAFPRLGLDADQENMILDIVNNAIERENQLLNSQVQQNVELRELIQRAVFALTPSSPYRPPQNYNADNVLIFRAN